MVEGGIFEVYEYDVTLNTRSNVKDTTLYYTVLYNCSLYCAFLQYTALSDSSLQYKTKYDTIHYTMMDTIIRLKQHFNSKRYDVTKYCRT